MFDRERNYVRFPGSGAADGRAAERPASLRIRRLVNDLAKDCDTPDDARFLDGKSGWLKLAGAAALLYAAYLIGWSNAEPAQRTALARRETAATARPPAALPAVAAAPATEKPLPLIASPPPAGRAVGNDEIREIQVKLQALGHNPGPLDGLFGPQTTGAVQRYELANQFEPTGHVDLRLLERLRQER